MRRPWARILFWTCWALSVYFALAELAVRNLFGYPSDNTFYWMALISLVASGFFLAEMVKPGFFGRLAKSSGE